MIDIVSVNRIVSDISIEIPFSFYYPYLTVLIVGATAWLGRLDVLAMRAYLERLPACALAHRVVAD